jgi:hypothetical protein
VACLRYAAVAAVIQGSARKVEEEVIPVWYDDDRDAG